MSDSIINAPLTFSYRAIELYRNLTIGIAPFYKKEANINKYNQMVLTELFTQLYATGESILMLTSHGAIWEADILLRTLFEGTIKYIYMMQDDLDKKSDLIEEYYDIIPEMQKISDHGKAVEALSILKLSGVDKHPFQVSILDEDELKELKDKYSKSRIKELSQKWSYKNILGNLIVKDNKYEVLTTTLYTYSFSSHLIHYDGECLRQRSGALMNNAAKGDQILDLAHLLRIISNVLSLGTIRVSEYAKVYNLNVEQYKKNLNDNFAFLNEIDEISNQVVDGKY
ncbi:hypothetical protein Clo1100_3392 [Clostridium sp. BNL1100]|nr:hypothetical protein Clo1100_3392 [Clostridium sp. BNL1100]